MHRQPNCMRWRIHSERVPWCVLQCILRIITNDSWAIIAQERLQESDSQEKINKNVQDFNWLGYFSFVWLCIVLQGEFHHYQLIGVKNLLIASNWLRFKDSDWNSFLHCSFKILTHIGIRKFHPSMLFSEILHAIFHFYWGSESHPNNTHMINVNSVISTFKQS